MIGQFSKVSHCTNVRSVSAEYCELKIKFLLYLNGFNHKYLYVLMRPERNDTGPINLLRFFWRYIRSGGAEYFELKIKFQLHLNEFNHKEWYVLMRFSPSWTI